MPTALARLAAFVFLLLSFLLGFASGALALDARDADAAAKRKDYATAFRIRAEILSDADPVNMRELALYHFWGHGTPKNLAKAAELMARAAGLGEREAIFNLGTFYEDGLGVARDEDEAWRLYLRSADLGVPDAQNNVGLWYAEGRHVRRDPVKARDWLQRAAAGKNPEAMMNLGNYYEWGTFGAPDMAAGRRYYGMAARLGHSGGQYNYGLHLMKAQGGPKDTVEGLAWLFLADEQRLPEARRAVRMLDPATPAEIWSAARRRMAALRKELPAKR